MTDLVTRTACGLYVLAGATPREWPNFTWTTQVADLPGENLDALALISQELTLTAGQETATGRFVTPTDVAYACLHDGEPDRVDGEDLAFADPEVTGDEIDADADADQETWTVCGVLEGTWRTVRIHSSAAAPRVAYFRAWEYARDQFGGYLLLAAVHPGHIANIDCFGYADPWARDDPTMRLTADRWSGRT